MNIDPELGQILPDSMFGKALTVLAYKSTIMVESGCFAGQGSTVCLWNGIHHPTQHLWATEQDAKRFQQATEFWGDEHAITLIHGRTLDVLHQLPKHIDLLLLDGGEDCTFDEFKALSPRVTRWIALDDTHEAKNKETFALAVKEGWQVLRYEPGDRNGWAILERHDLQKP